MEKKIINEIARLSVSIPSLSWRQTYLHLVKDENEGWKIHQYRADDNGFIEKTGPELATYDRAILTVRSNLLVNGRAIKPESYIALWRETEVLTIDKLLCKHGITVQIHCKFDLEIERANAWDKWDIPAHQKGSDLTSFAAFEDRYKQYFNGNNFTLPLENDKQSGDFMYVVLNFARLADYKTASTYSVSIVESDIKAEIAGLDEMAQQEELFGEPA